MDLVSGEGVQHVVVPAVVEHGADFFPRGERWLAHVLLYRLSTFEPLLSTQPPEKKREKERGPYRSSFTLAFVYGCPSRRGRLHLDPEPHSNAVTPPTNTP